MRIKKPKNPIKVAIFGSCTTRDIFNSKFNTSYKEYFEVVSFQNQTSIMSIMSPPVKYTEKSLLPLEGWDRESVQAELEKRFLEDMRKTKPDIVIVDFFADARFKTIAADESYITVNEWKTTKSDLYLELSKYNIPFVPNETQLKQSMQLFYEYMQKHLPKTKIILNQARGVKSYTDKDGEEKFFNLNFVSRLNKRWDMLDKLFIDIVNPIKIDVMNPTVKGYINHLWSIGYVHYTPNFYHNFLNTLISVELDDQIEFLQASLAKLVPTSLFPEEKLVLIEEIRANYISLKPQAKERMDRWLNGRYTPFLAQLVEYNKNIHHYVKFISYGFRGGLKNIIVRDLAFSEYLLEQVMTGKIFGQEDESAYAHLNYGNIMYHNFITATYPHEFSHYFKMAYKSLIFTHTKGKTDYLKNRSAYFLANLYAGNEEFEMAYEWYIKAIDTDKPAPNIYILPFLMLMRSVGLNGSQLFENVNHIFKKENTENKYFWFYLQSIIENKTIKTNIQVVIDKGNFNNNLGDKWQTKKIENYFSMINLYLKVNNNLSNNLSIKELQKLYRNDLLKEEAKAKVLFKMANIFAYEKNDINRAVLMASESITMHMDKDKLMFISNLILNSFAKEIRTIISNHLYSFVSTRVTFYQEEKSRNIAAWKRFIKHGFVSGYFEEEVDFLEFLLLYTTNNQLKKVLKTRLGYLYFTGTAGISEDNHEKPNIVKSREYFKDLGDNPLVKKYIQHPRLAIYQDMEQYVDIKKENYLFFENKKSDELLIVFSCAGSYSRYTQLKVFYEKNKTNVLFLNNPPYNWYHGDEWIRIQKIIDRVALKNFKKENIITYFGSMGGYAALRVGLTYNFRTIVFNPQIDLDIWIKHRPAISVRLEKEKKLYHLQHIETRAYEVTPIYYATSSAMEDVEAFKIFISKLTLCHEGLFFIEKIADNMHEGIFGHIYKDKQQDAVLNIANIQKKYETNTILPNSILDKDKEVFWNFVLSSMCLRIMIQIKNGTIYYATVKDNFLSSLKLDNIELF